MLDAIFIGGSKALRENQLHYHKIKMAPLVILFEDATCKNQDLRKQQAKRKTYQTFYPQTITLRCIEGYNLKYNIAGRILSTSHTGAHYYLLYVNEDGTACKVDNLSSANKIEMLGGRQHLAGKKPNTKFVMYILDTSTEHYKEFDQLWKNGNKGKEKEDSLLQVRRTKEKKSLSNGITLIYINR